MKDALADRARLRTITRTGLGHIQICSPKRNVAATLDAIRIGVTRARGYTHKEGGHPTGSRRSQLYIHRGDDEVALQDLRRRARFAIKNPRYALNAVVREFTFADERFLARLTGSSPRQIRMYLDEPMNTPAFAAHLGDEAEHFRSLSIESASLFAEKIPNQYAVIRATAPDCVAETGVANGVSSSYLLLALEKNGRGRLHLSALPTQCSFPPGKDPGWFVPHWLRAAWQVHLGDAREILPRLLTQLGKIGIFIHDSLHTYRHTICEFETAFPHLVSGGILISDDALWNNSFYDFARTARTPEAQILRGVGFLRKG